MVTPADIKQTFSGFEATDGEAGYLQKHAARLAYLVNLVQTYRDTFDVETILDVGPHFLTTCIKKFVRPEVTVSTLGWAKERLAPPGVVERHIEFDLNQCIDPSAFAEHVRFDLINSLKRSSI